MPLSAVFRWQTNDAIYDVLPRKWKRSDADISNTALSRTWLLCVCVCASYSIPAYRFIVRPFVRILGFGNVADAVEILAIGYILTVYEDTEGAITPWESSTLSLSRP